MDLQEFALVYPHFLITGEGIFPNIHLPWNFRELVPEFYASGGKERIEQYKNNLQKRLQEAGTPLDINLNWHDTCGLKNISVGVHGGLDLEGNLAIFQEHNLGWTNGFYAAFIAMEYVKELLK